MKEPVKKRETWGCCELCGREKPLTFHHLIPRTTHRKKWFQKNFDKWELRTRGLNLCRDCHNHLHTLYDEKTLGRQFNTLESLQQDEAVQRFVKWVRKKS
ncbi:hypothetical protein SAMN05421823_103749 [Catalinimonas alkaloidigena]|uniref:HNH endonuclease n=1 Tax=Catalinimonas alkaloidigena TaxID=1075417 RepID=A0A1G9FDX3_9BACT|nr:hypothetical protein [Catalinimonas alkaloidigena]SDK86546.1 hypothetical protein SAMN05421823_103749 [Catalinimonas alkaloidigena]